MHGGGRTREDGITEVGEFMDIDCINVAKDNESAGVEGNVRFSGLDVPARDGVCGNVNEDGGVSGGAEKNENEDATVWARGRSVANWFPRPCHSLSNVSASVPEKCAEGGSEEEKLENWDPGEMGEEGCRSPG